MGATIEISPMAGDDVKATSKQAISVADRLGITVEFDFNGVTCMARPGDCPDSLAADFHRALNNKSQIKIAAGKRRKQGACKTWYAVPDYRPDGQPSNSATVVNRAGELVATFESLEDAERAVEAVNGRT